MSHRLLKEQVASFIERSGLKAVILHEQPNGGKTIIEKFEKHGGGAGKAGRYSQPYHRVADIPGIEAARLKGERCV
jgi:hypothetical protein